MPLTYQEVRTKVATRRTQSWLAKGAMGSKRGCGEDDETRGMRRLSDEPWHNERRGAAVWGTDGGHGQGAQRRRFDGSVTRGG